MANPEHLQILKQGDEAWNQWRDQYGDIRPDLCGANLSDADLRATNLRGADLRLTYLAGADLRLTNLRGADLSGANLATASLKGVNLRGANLRDADLRRVDLTGANLRDADLRRAKLYKADLIWVDLTGARLNAADLSWANLTRAYLVGSNLSHACFCETVFGETTLIDVQGLETSRHSGPSTLDHRTLARSGPLPLAFLRGCGLPDTLIDYLPSLLNEPVQFYCFISHASKDHTFAERLNADLQNNGVRCFFAPDDLPIGAKIRVSIDESIRVCDKLLLVLSKVSVASQWVEQEVETALARERQQGTTILFPVRIDNTVMTLETGWPALIRNTRNIGDFRRWKTHGVYQKAFDRLLRDLKAEGRQPKASA